ncbi:DDT domain-containing protein [Quillaja saponaria]|uniref:DDT domain-containing protein n=1 Tax=Quillaja saponaria TaxID=32244 RepID=A0AAD7KSC8_QUISA|nr:DDT domain-containing protein [Quillaja saponaria]
MSALRLLVSAVPFQRRLNLKTKNEHLEEEPIKYPIDDLLVKPDPDFTVRPSPSRDFNVSMDCVALSLLKILKMQ